MEEERKVCSHCGGSKEEGQDYCNKCGAYIGERSEILEVVEEIQQSTESLFSKFKRSRRIWLKEGSIFAGIVVILSLLAAFGIGKMMRQSQGLQYMMEWLGTSEVNQKMMDTLMNPMLLAYSRLFGGETSLYLTFSKINEYKFSIMLPYFFIIVTILILWIGEKIRFGLTKKERDIYSTIAMAALNGIVVIVVAFLLSRQMTIRGEAVRETIQGTKLHMAYGQYVLGVEKPSLKICSTVNFLKLWGTSFLITLLTLTLVAKKHLVLGKNKKIIETLGYCIKGILTISIVLSVVVLIKLMSMGIDLLGTNFGIEGIFETLLFLIGISICALLSGEVPLITYIVDANTALDVKMKVFGVEAYFKKNLEVMDNPLGGYYTVFLILLGLVILIGSIKLWTRYKADIRQAIKAALIVGISMGLIGGILSRLGAASIYFGAKTPNRDLSYTHLLASIGGKDFGMIFWRSFFVVSGVVLMGWGIKELAPRLSSRIMSLFCTKKAFFLFVLVVSITSIISVQTVNNKELKSIQKIYDNAVKKSQINILMRLERIFNK